MCNTTLKGRLHFLRGVSPSRSCISSCMLLVSLLLWVVLGKFRYCTVLFWRGKCCPFLVFVFWGFYLCDFSVFLSFFICQVPSLGKLLCNRIFQTCWLTNGNLAYRKLLVLQGEMLPFFIRILRLASFVSLSYIGNGLSWNECRGNTATTHKSNFF